MKFPTKQQKKASVAGDLSSKKLKKLVSGMILYEMVNAYVSEYTSLPSTTM